MGEVRESMRAFWRLVWLFTFASLFGFLLESLESLFSLGYVQNRQGMLFGPFTPVYGGGAVLLALLYPLVRRLPSLPLFLAGVLAGSGMEYVWSVFQERLFGVQFWNYSHLPLQLHGRVNLLFSLFWGALALLFWRRLWPALLSLWERLPAANTAWIALVLCLLLTGDALFSSAALLRQQQRMQGVAAFSPLTAYLDRVWPDEALRARFPTMRLPTRL